VNEVHGAEVKTFLKRLRNALPTESLYALPCPDWVTRFRRSESGWILRQTSEEWSAGGGDSNAAGRASFAGCE
jgi:hypothetical protein